MFVFFDSEREQVSEFVLAFSLSTDWQFKGSSTQERLGAAHAFPAQVSTEASGPPSWAHLSCPHPSHSKIPCAWTGLGQAHRSLDQDREFALLCFAFTCRYPLHLVESGAKFGKGVCFEPCDSTRGSSLFPVPLTLSYPYPCPCLCIDNIWVEFTFDLI